LRDITEACHDWVPWLPTRHQEASEAAREEYGSERWEIGRVSGTSQAGAPIMQRIALSLFEEKPALRWRSRATRQAACLNAGVLQRIGEGNKRGLLAIRPVTVKTIVVANDRFGAPVANNEWLAAVPTGLRASVHEIRHHFFHLTAPSG